MFNSTVGSPRAGLVGLSAQLQSNGQPESVGLAAHRVRRGSSALQACGRGRHNQDRRRRHVLRADRFHVMSDGRGQRRCALQPMRRGFVMGKAECALWLDQHRSHREDRRRKERDAPSELLATDPEPLARTMRHAIRPRIFTNQTWTSCRRPARRGRSTMSKRRRSRACSAGRARSQRQGRPGDAVPLAPQKRRRGRDLRSLGRVAIAGLSQPDSVVGG